jgi:hypothetical protein
MLLIILLSSSIVLTSAASWSEVVQYTGSAGQDTPYFSCGHVEWRIRWSWQLGSQGSTGGIVAYVYDNQSDLVTTIAPWIDGARSGVTYIHNHEGTFYLSISTTNVASYTFTIEQDTDSVPEFSPVVLLLLAIGLPIAVMTAAKLGHLRSRARALACTSILVLR